MAVRLNDLCFFSSLQLKNTIDRLEADSTVLKRVVNAWYIKEKHERYMKRHTIAASKGLGDVQGPHEVVVRCQVLNVKSAARVMWSINSKTTTSILPTHNQSSLKCKVSDGRMMQS